MLRKISPSEFQQIYDIMEASFPTDERRTYAEQEALLSDSKYSILTECDEGRLSAFIAIWNFDAFVYVEHFATHPSSRNTGIGSRILKKLSEIYDKPICLEVEPPEGNLQCRRIEFYRRNGFYLNEYPYMQPPISKGKNAIPLMIMTSPSPIDQEMFDFIKNKLYKEVYKVAQK